MKTGMKVRHKRGGWTAVVRQVHEDRETIVVDHESDPSYSGEYAAYAFEPVVE